MSLKSMGLDYVDLYLVHWPVATNPNGTCFDSIVTTYHLTPPQGTTIDSPLFQTAPGI
jgi:diketogulonate reductase-like aldo/keto reductase